jgi:hypothetical protein
VYVSWQDLWLERGLRLAVVVVAAASLLVGSGLFIWSAGPELSHAGTPTNGAMAVDCDADTAGVQTTCTYGPGEHFHVGVNLSDAPSPDGYFGAQAKLRWSNDLVDYLPEDNPANEAVWTGCNVPARTMNEPGDRSVRFGCVAFPLPVQGVTYEGDLARFEFQCLTTPKGPVLQSEMSPPADGPNEIHFVLVPRAKDPDQLGTVFIDPGLGAVDPGREGAVVTCQGGPPPPPSPGVLAVDCNASAAGVQTLCFRNSVVPFYVQIHVLEAPARGYFGLQTKVRWPDGSLGYLPADDPQEEKYWLGCYFSPSRIINQPADPSVVFGCVPFPLPWEPITWTGPVIQFQMECSDLPPQEPPGPTTEGLSEPNLLLVPREGDAQLGTHFLDDKSSPLDPELRGTTIDCYVDGDGDGCATERELSPKPGLGGGRDPGDFWDFFDTPAAGNIRDGAVTSADVARVVQRFGTNDLGTGAFNRQSNPLSMPGAPLMPSSARQNYHPSFDRSPSATALSGPADGTIPVGDIALIVAQFGHTCVDTDD